MPNTYQLAEAEIERLRKVLRKCRHYLEETPRFMVRSAGYLGQDEVVAAIDSALVDAADLPTEVGGEPD